MCKIILSIHKKNTDELFQKYILQVKKQNANKYHSGYGFAWLSKNNKWKIFKNENPISQTKYNINSNIIIGHLREIYIENPTDNIDDKISLQDTHPFIYKEWIFIHQGNLLLKYKNKLVYFQTFYREPFFQNKIKKIYQYISPNFHTLIQGNTDSELIFYLFLTIYYNNIHIHDEKNRIKQSFTKANNILENIGFINNSNFIFSNNNFIIVVNIYSNNSNISLSPVSLYIDNYDGIAITNTPLTENNKKIRKNTFMFYKI